MRLTMLTTLALTAMVAACGYPNPDAYPQTDRFVGVQARVFGAPQAPQQNVYCYRTSSGVADCANQSMPSQNYRFVNAFVAAPPVPGQPSAASGGPVQPGPISPNIAPPPRIRQSDATPPAAPAPAPTAVPQAPLSLRPQGPAAAPADAAPPAPPAEGAAPPG
jgi:hypothetical protein